MTAIPMLEHGELVYAGRINARLVLVADPRTALGTGPSKAYWPDAACVHCFAINGALIQATCYDTIGQPCCPMCAANPNRRAA